MPTTCLFCELFSVRPAFDYSAHWVDHILCTVGNFPSQALMIWYDIRNIPAGRDMGLASLVARGKGWKIFRILRQRLTRGE